MKLHVPKSLAAVSRTLALATSIALTGLVVTPPSLAAMNACEQYLEPKPAFPQDEVTLRKVQTEIQNSKASSSYFLTKMRKTSDTIKEAYKGKVMELDVLCLGAGPQCAAASLALGQAPVRALVLEKSDAVANTFYNKSFNINSEEASSLSMHAFPGGVGTLADHTSQKYGHSSQLASHIQAQQYASNVPVLLGTAMTNAKIVRKGSEEIVEITTDQGIVIHTKKFLMATGLGEIGTKIRDAGYKAAFDANLKISLESPEKVLPIMATDTFLIAAKKAIENGTKITMPSKLVIVGDGDGARIVIEALASPNVILPKDFSISWIGNANNTASDFIAGQGGFDRYLQKIRKFYENGQIHGTPGHVQTWQKNADGTMRLTTADKETQQSYEASGQMVIDSTGYNNVIPGTLAKMGADPAMIDVTGPLPEMNLENTVLARQVTVGGKAVPAYTMGAAAGPLATRDELKNSPNKNPIAIFNTIARTSQFVSRLLGIEPPKSQRGSRVTRPEVRSSEELIQETEKKRSEQKNRSLTWNFHFDYGQSAFELAA